MKNILSLVLLLLGFYACKQDSGFDPSLLSGDWQGKSWLIEGKSSGEDAAQVRFSFDGNSGYTAGYGEDKETGTYRIEGSKLYTTETGKSEKVVLVEKINKDTLVMGMNRMGRPEQLVLVRPNK